jgi:parallel beta-helix repeat protein
MLAVLATQIVRALDHASLARSSEIETTSRKISEGQKTRVQVGKQIQKSTPAKRKPRRASQSKNEPPTLIVDALHRGDHSSLTEALRAAGPGHRIVVRPGLYAEGIMNDKPVEIIGDGERGDVVFEANGKDVILFQATMSRIVNLTIRQMGGGRWFGVDIAQGRLDLEGCDITSESLACVAIHGGADPRIRRNRICNGKEAGVVIYENGLGTLEDNEIFGNTNSGVSIFSGGDPTLRRNRIYNGRSAGVVIRENGIGTLEDNEIFGNAFAGIEVKSGGNSVLRRNRIHSGKQGGVFVSENGLGTLEDNEIFGNAYAGVEIKSGGNPTLRRNRIHDGKTSGILVWENGLGTLEDNEILGNAYAGVEIRSGGNPTLRRNVITKNLFQAVRVHSGGRGEIIENDLRDNAMGAIAISEECKINVRVEGNQE